MSDASTILQAGTPAPDFTLPVTPDQTVSLSEFRGRPVILAFYPADWSPGLRRPDGALQRDPLRVPQASRRAARHLGGRRVVSRRVRRDAQAALPAARRLRAEGRRWRGATASTREHEGTAERALFVIDGEGIIRWSYLSPVGVNPGADGILEALESLDASARRTQLGRSGMTTNQQGTLRPAVSEGDHVLGPDDAPITLVEYGDFQCPHCARAHGVLPRVLKRLGDRARFVFRHFPLAESHPNALHAAEAAESVAAQAGEEGFWQMHDLLYDHQRDWRRCARRRASRAARPRRRVRTRRRWRSISTGDSYEQRVKADFMSGVRSGVNGTPTFFINGRRFEGDWTSVDAFVAALEEAAT